MAENYLDFICTNCGKSYSNKGNLTKHSKNCVKITSVDGLQSALLAAKIQIETQEKELKKVKKELAQTKAFLAEYRERVLILEQQNSGSFTTSSSSGPVNVEGNHNNINSPVNLNFNFPPVLPRAHGSYLAPEVTYLRKNEGEGLEFMMQYCNGPYLRIVENLFRLIYANRFHPENYCIYSSSDRHTNIKVCLGAGPDGITGWEEEELGYVCRTVLGIIEHATVIADQGVPDEYREQIIEDPTLTIQDIRNQMDAEKRKLSEETKKMFHKVFYDIRDQIQLGDKQWIERKRQANAKK